MTPSSPYRYSRLQDRRQIRLLVLKPGDQFADIRISIFPVVLDEQPTYEALSYTWGDPRKTTTVCCNEHGDTIRITLNCEAALRRLRAKDEERVLWIDAICIDQNNIEERNHQVQLMSTIYQQAQRVLAYLGETSDDSDLGMNFILEDAASTREPSRPSVGLTPDTITSSPEQRAIDSILQRSYKSVGWKAFSSAVYYVDKNKKLHLGAKYHQKPPKVVFYRDESTKFSSGQKLNADKPDSLLAFLKDTRHCKSSDPRDKIYASLGMTPDYAVSTRDTFISLTKYFLTRDKNLDVLCHVHGAPSIHGLPSWVPDWSYPRLSDVLGHEKTILVRPYKAALNTIASVIFGQGQNSDILIVEGTPVDRLSQVGRSYRTGDEMSTSSLCQWKDIAESLACSSAESNTLHPAFIDTLIAYPAYAVPNPFAQFYTAWCNFTFRDQTHCTPTSVDTAKAAIFCEQLNKVCHGRCFFVTEKGYLGLGPEDIQGGDLVAVLLGGSVPFVMRGEGGEYQSLIGECYVHGFMKGEALKDLETKGCKFLIK